MFIRIKETKEVNEEKNETKNSEEVNNCGNRIADSCLKYI